MIVDSNKLEDYNFKKANKVFDFDKSHIIAIDHPLVRRTLGYSLPMDRDFWENESIRSDDVFMSPTLQRKLFKFSKNIDKLGPLLPPKPRGRFARNIRRTFRNLRDRLPPRRYVYRLVDSD